MENALIGFIGGGHMTTSLISGLIDSGFEKSRLLVADRNENKRAQLKTEFGIQVSDSPKNIIEKANVIVLAVKPQDMHSLCEEISHSIQQKKPLIVSIAAGIQTHHYEEWLGARISIVRAMPNTPALLRTGATGLYATTKVSEEEKSLAESLLRTVGIVVWVDHERELDNITVLSGSGPAYFFLFMEAMQQGAETLGLSKEVAKILTMQTALGAARMALESELSLEELRKKVASKGGVTEVALSTLENGGLRELMKKTLQSAKERTETISKQFDKV